jgi:hypothetical protein
MVHLLSLLVLHIIRFADAALLDFIKTGNCDFPRQDLMRYCWLAHMLRGKQQRW